MFQHEYVSAVFYYIGLNNVHTFCVSERSVQCMTRALKHAVMQQQKINVDKALQILDQETPPLVVDKDRLKVCGIK